MTRRDRGPTRADARALGRALRLRDLRPVEVTAATWLVTPPLRRLEQLVAVVERAGALGRPPFRLPLGAAQEEVARGYLCGGRPTEGALALATRLREEGWLAS